MEVAFVAVVVDPRLGTGDRLFDRPDRRQGGVLDVDCSERVESGVFVDRRHRGDRVPDVSDFVERQRVLVLGNRKDAERDREVASGRHRDHSRHREGPRGIHAMRACATFERRSLQWSIRGRKTSSANFVCPVTFAAASTLAYGRPTMRVRALV